MNAMRRAVTRAFSGRTKDQHHIWCGSAECKLHLRHSWVAYTVYRCIQKSTGMMNTRHFKHHRTMRKDLWKSLKFVRLFSQVMPRPDVLDFDGFVLRRGAANRAPVRPPDLRQASGTTKSPEMKDEEKLWEIFEKMWKDYIGRLRVYIKRKRWTFSNRKLNSIYFWSCILRRNLRSHLYISSSMIHQVYPFMKLVTFSHPFCTCRGLKL